LDRGRGIDGLGSGDLVGGLLDHDLLVVLLVAAEFAAAPDDKDERANRGYNEDNDEPGSNCGGGFGLTVKSSRSTDGLLLNLGEHIGVGGVVAANSRVVRGLGHAKRLDDREGGRSVGVGQRDLLVVDIEKIELRDDHGSLGLRSDVVGLVGEPLKEVKVEVAVISPLPVGSVILHVNPASVEGSAGLGGSKVLAFVTYLRHLGSLAGAIVLGLGPCSPGVLLKVELLRRD